MFRFLRITKPTRQSIGLLPWVLLLSCLTFQVQASDHETGSVVQDDATLIQTIATSSLQQRLKAIEALAASDSERKLAVLSALQQGQLYADRGKPPQVAISENNQWHDAITHDVIESDDALRRIPINNPLRNRLRTLLAEIQLDADDSSMRYQAVRRMISDGVDENTLQLLSQRLQEEQDDMVSEAIESALALYAMQHGDETAQLAAIQQLRTSLEPEIKTALTRIASSEAPASVKEAADKALQKIDSRISFFRFAENVFFGLSLGSVLLLAAIGLAITFGVMGVINMAHGELMMIGAYTTWMVQQIFPNHIGYSLAIAVPAAFLIAGLIGIAIERGVIRFLYGRPLETLLATFGISLILQQAARSIFSPLNRAVSLPDWMSGSLIINPVFSITWSRLYILLFGLMVFFALLFVLKKTSLGLKVRAVSQNRAMARAVGVRANWVDALTFGLGSGIAGVAGVALSQLTNVGPNLGQAYIIDSFMVVVFGGVGNLWGTLVGAMGLGVLNKFMEPWAGAVLAKVVVLVLLILFIQKRPKGIFPQKGRAAAD